MEYLGLGWWFGQFSKIQSQMMIIYDIIIISIAWLFDYIIIEYVNLLSDHDHEF